MSEMIKVFRRIDAVSVILLLLAYAFLFYSLWQEAYSDKAKVHLSLFFVISVMNLLGSFYSESRLMSLLDKAVK